MSAREGRALLGCRPRLASLLPVAAVALALHGATARAAEEASPPGPRRAASPPSCPSLVFPRFLDAFAGDVALQAAFTRFPLVKRSVDAAADPEPRSVEERVRREDVALPLFPSKRSRQRQRLSLRVRAVGEATREAVVWEEDTDHQVVFRFERTDCWRLVLVDDQSL